MLNQPLLAALRAALPAHLTVVEDPELLADADEHEAVRVTGPGDFSIGVTADLQWPDDLGEPEQVFTIWAHDDLVFTSSVDSLTTLLEGHAREWAIDHV